MPAQRIAYRPDIDGLRAVAVLAVVGFHAAPHYLPGGFVGVDVFFVISGFLITRLLLVEAERGTLTLAGFWSRRVRRIFPALFTVLAATLAAGWYLLLTNEFTSLSRHAVASAAFVQNVVLWRETGYFDTAAELKPLLHIWSLSVEEQFYLLWPLLCAWGYARGRRVLLWLSLGLLLASFTVSVAQAAQLSPAGFYLLPSRWWELMAGCLLAQRLQATAHAAAIELPAHLAWLRELAAAAGVTLIALSFLVIDRSHHFPGASALLPVAGTLVLIAVGPDTWIHRALLSRRTLVFVGLVSYPLYLWHWPMLAFLRILGGPPDPAQIAIAMAIAFVLAVATFLFVERPLRRSRKRTTVGALLIAMVVAAIAGASGATGWFTSRLAGTPADRFDVAAHDWRFPGPGFRRTYTPEGLAVWRAGEGPRTVLVYGDSNAQQYGPRVDALFEAQRLKGTEVVFATTGSCPPLPGVKVASREGCAAFGDKADVLARSPGVSTIIVTAQWVGYLGNPAFTLSRDGRDEVLRAGDPAVDAAIARLGERIRAWRAAGKEVYLVLNIPVSPDVDPRNLLQRSWRGDTTIRTPSIDRAVWERGTGAYLGRIAEVARAAGATVIDPVHALCAPTSCPAVTGDGEPIYRDAAHLRASFVRGHVTYLDEALTGGARSR